MSDFLFTLYGKPVHTEGTYAVFVAEVVNIDINSTAYAVFNMETEVREAEFSNLAHAIAGSQALNEALKEVRTKKKTSIDELDIPGVDLIQ